MAIIYSYPLKKTPGGEDLLVITDSAERAPKKNRTKSITVGDLASFVISSKSAITGSGTLNTVPIFTGSTTIGDSLLTYNGVDAFTFSSIVKFTPGSANQVIINNGNVNAFSITTQSPSIIRGILDNTGSTGTSGQVLSSTGSDIQWINDGEGFTSYVAKITQSSTNAPVATVINNNTGLTPTWSRSNTGDYRLSGINGVTAFIQVTGGDSGSAATTTTLLVKSVNPSQIQIVNLKLVDGQPADGITLGFIEVRKYS